MDIAVLADIHGNYIALERCLDYAISHDIRTFIFLGDYIGELAYPERTMRIVYELSDKYQCYFIKGNKEDYWINYRANGETGWSDCDSITGSLWYAYHSLTSKDIDFFESLPPSQLINIPDRPSITICHGSPNKVNEKLLPNDSKTLEILSHVTTPLVLCGHTHIQGKIEYENVRALNPGSVGVPLFSGGKTQFLLLHGNNGIWTDEFISLEYDIDRAIKEIHKVDLDKHAPYWSRITEEILHGGNISHGQVLARAMELNREEAGECRWPHIPEKYMEKAFREMTSGLK